MKRFELDEEQVDAILELKLYKLARLEILVIQKELKEKRGRGQARLAGDPQERRASCWAVVQGRARRGRRARTPTSARTKIGGAAARRWSSSRRPSSSTRTPTSSSRATAGSSACARSRIRRTTRAARGRRGDGRARRLDQGATWCFFTQLRLGLRRRASTTSRPSTGYGDPVQKLFKFDDGERVVGALSLDPRAAAAREAARGRRGSGYGLRFALAPHTEVSTRAGRRFAKPGEGDEIVGVRAGRRRRTCSRCVTATRHALVCKADEINELAGPGPRRHRHQDRATDDAVVGFLCTARQGRDRRARDRRRASKLELAARRSTRSARAAARAARSSRKDTVDAS